jgi:hypothetical protein
MCEGRLPGKARPTGGHAPVKRGRRSMVSVRGLGRLGMLAVGLGIGATVASSPGIASADPVSFDFNDMAISFDGYSLFKDGTATANSGTHGDFNFAFADGAGADAAATGGNGDVAEAEGIDASAVASGGNYDTAVDIGNNADPFDTGAYAGGNEFLFGGPGNHDLAFVVGNDSFAGAGGSGGPLAPTFAGDNDIATVFGTGSDASAGSDNLASGDFDLASAFGDSLNPDATGANYLVDILPMVTGLDSALSTFLTDIAALF